MRKWSKLQKSLKKYKKTHFLQMQYNAPSALLMHVTPQKSQLADEKQPLCSGSDTTLCG